MRLSWAELRLGCRPVTTCSPVVRPVPPLLCYSQRPSREVHTIPDITSLRLGNMQIDGLPQRASVCDWGDGDGGSGRPDWACDGRGWARIGSRAVRHSPGNWSDGDGRVGYLRFSRSGRSRQWRETQSMASLQRTWEAEQACCAQGISKFRPSLPHSHGHSSNPPR